MATPNTSRSLYCVITCCHSLGSQEAHTVPGARLGEEVFPLWLPEGRHQLLVGIPRNRSDREPREQVCMASAFLPVTWESGQSGFWWPLSATVVSVTFLSYEQ